MPVFTAIAAAVVAWAGITGIAATVLTFVGATALAMVTSRLINGSPGGGGGNDGGGAVSQGTRVQLAPEPNNKLPVVYGTVYTPGMLIDAYITNENKSMYYVYAISETTNQQASFTASIVPATYRTYTAPQTGTVASASAVGLMTVSAGTSGTILPGMLVSGAAANTRVLEYVTGTGGVGTYYVTVSQTSASAARTGTYSYTIDDVYYNDLRLVFGDGEDGYKVRSGKKNADDPDPTVEDHVDTNFDGKVELWVWAGDSRAVSQIKGPTTKVAAYTVIPDSNWTDPASADSQRMQGILFAVLKINYDAEKGFTGQPSLTFKISNTLKNPGAVLYDYMTGTRYGAGIATDDINAAGLVALGNHANQLVPYAPYNPATGGNSASTTQVRYEINGIIDTSRNCKDNIDALLLNSASWMSYDVHSGQWRIIPKRAITGTVYAYSGSDIVVSSEPAPAVAFSDDNIIGGIQLGSTRLDDLYNNAEFEFFDRNLKDARAFGKITIATTSELRNENEHDNTAKYTFEFCNNSVQAERIANLELKQSRDDLTITFTTNYAGLQVQAGDVIGVKSTLYGWYDDGASGIFPNDSKYFRVLRVKEKEGEDGSITCEISALEYNADVYADESINEFSTIANIGIIPRNSSGNLLPPGVAITNVDNTAGVPNFTGAITIPAGGPYDELQIYYAEGDDYAGFGGDLSFKAQAYQTQLQIIRWDGPGVVYATTEDTVGTVLTSTAAPTVNGNQIVAYGYTGGFEPGNGKTGQYTLASSVAVNTAIKSMKGTITHATFTGYLNFDGVTYKLHVKTAPSTALTTQHLITTTGVNFTDSPYTDAIPKNTVIGAALTTEAGDYATYKLNYVYGTTPATVGSSASPINITARKPYPSLNQFLYLTSIRPQVVLQASGNPDNVLFQRDSVIPITITSLPANNEGKRYFIKCRLGVRGEFGPFSDLGTVDLEVPTVYWEPDSRSSQNIKEQLVRMDFGLFTIPRNGLWLIRTATQLDGGRLNNTNADYFNLDLGNLQPENEIAPGDLIEDFRFDPQ